MRQLQFAVMTPDFQLAPEQQRDVLAETQSQLGLPTGLPGEFLPVLIASRAEDGNARQ